MWALRITRSNAGTITMLTDSRRPRNTVAPAREPPASPCCQSPRKSGPGKNTPASVVDGLSAHTADVINSLSVPPLCGNMHPAFTLQKKEVLKRSLPSAIYDEWLREDRAGRQVGAIKSAICQIPPWLSSEAGGDERLLCHGNTCRTTFSSLCPLKAAPPAAQHGRGLRPEGEMRPHIPDPRRSQPCGRRGSRAGDRSGSTGEWRSRSHVRGGAEARECSGSRCD
ncbi:hypothetical protein AAFF_G00058370 [Aldrovandia affinis]|uniref:Uncharacterized protein n=1 Tax=Aldrovandia affinis TaxID=143900 RepID=A0AAD7S0F7_9TELE|nr:hypothetical protein AAFF_G00058370 [Aldrovandia affinis]